MKLLFILAILCNIVFASDPIDYKAKTEENRALILQQQTLRDFYQFEGNPWFEDEEFSRELLGKYIYAVRFVKNEKVLNDKSIFKNIDVSIYEYLGEDIRSDKEILLSLGKGNCVFLPFKHATQSLKKDKDLVNLLLDRGDNIYPYIDKSLKEDETIIQKSMKLSVLNYKCLPKKYRKDKELTIRAIKKYGYLLEYADESLKDDIDVIYAGLKRGGYPYVIEYASQRIRDNKELMLKVIEKSPGFLKKLSDNLKKDKEIVALATRKNYSNFRYADASLKKDKEFVKTLILKWGHVLKHADKSLQSDPELIEMALEHHLGTLAFASEEIRKNKTYALKALSNSRNSVKSVHPSMYEDFTYMSEAVKRDPFNIKYVQGELKNNVKLAFAAIKKDIRSYIYLPENLQEDSHIKSYLPTKKEAKRFNIEELPLKARKGAIRGIRLSFLIVSTEPLVEHRLISPPKGMKIIKQVQGGESCFPPHVDEGKTGALVQWDIPMDIEEKEYSVTVKAINKQGYMYQRTFSIKVPKTKPIQTKVENNELIVFDKNYALHGMKMKGHNGEDISNVKLRSVDYGDVWKLRVKNKKKGDIVQRVVYVIDNMPDAVDLKFPEYDNTLEKAKELGASLFRYKANYFGEDWIHADRNTYQYEGTDGVTIPYMGHSQEYKGSRVFLDIVRKSQLIESKK